MRNTQNISLTRSESIPPPDDETTWSLSGATVGFVAWLIALGIPYLWYGNNTLFFFLYTWPFFLALMPVAVVIGVAIHSLVNSKLRYSIIVTLLTVAALCGLLFLWLMG
ncbi:DUF3561 family protein [Pseudocitrobacter faecalis]|uniref:DUF3561 family protein n=1 Tax=Pseudocitrobacter faecalis TaxID=1398493 RepID=UPI0038999EFD